jgi:flagellar transcriptional activator FlhD
MTNMKAQIQAEIRDANMAYLNMAQSLIRQDLQSAVRILGMSEDAAEMIKTLSDSQKASIADSDILLCRFGVSDDVVWNLLTSHPTRKPEAENATRLLADILLAGRFALAA